MAFIAMGFGTAAGKTDSAWPKGIGIVENGHIIEAYHSLIQPPNNALLPFENKPLSLNFVFWYDGMTC